MPPSLRRLVASPGYAAAIVGTLALAIGATTAMFSAVYAVLMNPLPIRDPGQVVIVWGNDPRRNYDVVELSYRQIEELTRASRSFVQTAVVASSTWSAVLEGQGDPVRLQSAGVSSSFFDTLGAAPLHGRLLGPSDDAPDARVIVLAHGMWRQRFGGDPAIVGRPVRLDGESFEVVGVMPPDFDYPAGTDYWTPVMHVLAEASASWKADAMYVGLFFMVGRLNPGITPALARDDLAAFARQRPRGPMDPFPERVIVTTLFDHLIGPARPALWALFGAVAVLLLTACANASGLMLTRVSLRHREQAIRLALGATRGEVARRWMLETAVLVGAAALVGVAIAAGLTRVIVALAPEGIPRLDQVSISLPVAAFTLLVVLLAALLCAWAPARHAGTATLAEALAEGGRTTAGTAVHRARSTLLVLQIAFAFVLLVSAGLVVRSFAALQRLDIGFEPSPQVLTMSVQPRAEQPPANQWMRELMVRVAGLPGVEAAGGVYLRPLALGPIGMGTWVVVEGQPETQETAAANPVLNYQVATPDYFRAMRIPLKRGRVFTAQDTATSERVAVIGESTATRLWPGQDPIGKRFWTSSFIRGDPKGARRTVVGIVSDVRYRGIDQVHLDVYDPASQTPLGATDLVVRTTGDPLALASTVQAEARRLDPGVLVSGIATTEAIVSRAIAPWRFSAWVFSLFAVVSCALSSVGLFSLVSLDVAERRRELAIRIAVGANRRAITLGVLRSSAARVLCGLALGLVAAVVGTRALGALLFGVELLDAVTYAAVVLLLTVVVLLASYLPARAAARVDPVELLRG